MNGASGQVATILDSLRSLIALRNLLRLPPASTEASLLSKAIEDTAEVLASACGLAGPGVAAERQVQQLVAGVMSAYSASDLCTLFSKFSQLAPFMRAPFFSVAELTMLGRS